MADVPRASTGGGDVSNDLLHALDSHGDRLLRSAWLLCGNETEAQDLVQETFLQAFKSAHRFRGTSSIYTWLHGILRNLCHQHLRQQNRLVFEEELVAGATLQPGEANASDQNFCAVELRRALQKLSLEHREVIVLRYYENLRIQEIASQTGVTQGTVKSRLHYAMRCLGQFVPKELNLFVSCDTNNRTTEYDLPGI